MAVTSIWPVSGRVENVIDYAANPEKTTLTNPEASSAFHAIDNVLEYTANEIKTEQGVYVSGVNCVPSNAQTHFMNTKRKCLTVSL